MPRPRHAPPTWRRERRQRGRPCRAPPRPTAPTAASGHGSRPPKSRRQSRRRGRRRCSGRRRTCQKSGERAPSADGSRRAARGRECAEKGMESNGERPERRVHATRRDGFEQRSRTLRGAEKRWKVAVTTEEPSPADEDTCGGSGGTQRPLSGPPHDGEQPRAERKKVANPASSRAVRRPAGLVRARAFIEMVKPAQEPVRGVTEAHRSS